MSWCWLLFSCQRLLLLLRINTTGAAAAAAALLVMQEQVVKGVFVLFVCLTRFGRTFLMYPSCGFVVLPCTLEVLRVSETASGQSPSGFQVTSSAQSPRFISHSETPSAAHRLTFNTRSYRRAHPASGAKEGQML